MRVPLSLPSLLKTCYLETFPEVNKHLALWREQACLIPNDELRKQAMESIKEKTFHCEGGSIYASLAGKEWRKAIAFIVAFQSISDYLDNLCDRSSSMDPDDFRLLHEAMFDALSLEPASIKNYYRLRIDQDDQGYLNKLVRVCKNTIQEIENYPTIEPELKQLASMYIDLQVHKHVREKERVPRLQKWHQEQCQDRDLTWYEFAAASGSTLGIFCIISYALNNRINSAQVYQSFFPSIQGLHILLDYYIDQTEDQLEGDLNFCSYYSSEKEMEDRIITFYKRSKFAAGNLPDPSFHQLIINGLVGLYLSDRKTNSIQKCKTLKRSLLQQAGMQANMIYWNGRVYRRIKRGDNSVYSHD
ncbi:tetraprenyl-beta-curcumene synthase family protein [Halalkalibacillus halophilus]|uniref:tetraprenyl-beta-curcumene synthase family protein n=1 Tax=Halalkalibacillus halophilus TaxID=392827 RepID=UPI000428AF0F|nr:tetraprenyl-beta-curcumene synthase family protein [Halalkalibacillus halophilus]